MSQITQPPPLVQQHKQRPPTQRQRQQREQVVAQRKTVQGQQVQVPPTCQQRIDDLTARLVTTNLADEQMVQAVRDLANSTALDCPFHAFVVEWTHLLRTCDDGHENAAALWTALAAPAPQVVLHPDEQTHRLPTTHDHAIDVQQWPRMEEPFSLLCLLRRTTSIDDVTLMMIRDFFSTAMLAVAPALASAVDVADIDASPPSYRMTLQLLLRLFFNHYSHHVSPTDSIPYLMHNTMEPILHHDTRTVAGRTWLRLTFAFAPEH